jgi:putative transposase
MFRPHFTRKASRGEVHVFNNIYFSEALMNVDGDEVMVGVDIHNANTVVVRRMTGEFVCEAIWDGNKRAAFPVSMVEKARDDRAARRSGRLEKALDEVERERNPAITVENAPDFSQLLQPDFTPLPLEDDEPLHMYEFEREEWLANKQQKAI